MKKTKALYVKGPKVRCRAITHQGEVYISWQDMMTSIWEPATGGAGANLLKACLEQKKTPAYTLRILHACFISLCVAYSWDCTEPGSKPPPLRPLRMPPTRLTPPLDAQPPKGESA